MKKNNNNIEKEIYKHMTGSLYSKISPKSKNKKMGKLKNKYKNSENKNEE